MYGIDDENTPLAINENDSETRKALKRAMNEQIFKKRQQDFLSGKTSLSDLATGHKQNFFKPILNNGAGEFDLKNILLPDVYSIKNKLKDALKLKDIHLPKELPKIPMEVPDFYVTLEMYDLPDNELILAFPLNTSICCLIIFNNNFFHVFSPENSCYFKTKILLCM